MITGISMTQVLSTTQQRLAALREAFEAVSNLYKWSSAQALTDLESLGFSAADAQSLQTAIADANELAVLYNGGSLGTYTLPYNFSASQRQVMGPQ